MALKRRRFQTAELMARAVEEYFEERWSGKVGSDGKVAIGPRPPTLSGLALALGFSDLRSLLAYEGYEDQDYKHVIDTAKLVIMDDMEQRVQNGKAPVFKLLQNMAPDVWRDRSEQKVEVEAKEAPDRALLTARLKALHQEKAIERKDRAVIEHDPEDDDSWM